MAILSQDSPRANGAHRDRPGPGDCSATRAMIDHIIGEIGLDRAMDRLLMTPPTVEPMPSPPVEETTQPDPGDYLRELLIACVGRFEASRAYLARLDEVPQEAKDADRSAWKGLRTLAKNQLHDDEASLSYHLEAGFNELAEGDRRVSTWGPFVPFGVVRDGIAYVVRHDPANMRPKIITTVRLDMLLDLDEREGD